MKKILLMLLILCFSIGCASTQSPSSLAQLQIRVNQLERQLNERDQQIEELRFMVNNLSAQIDSQENYSFKEPILDLEDQKQESTAAASASSDEDNIIRVAASEQDVQRALKSAGYYSGDIDGVIGSGSKQAIRDFQREHDLKVDGIVGKNTWAELKNYLN